MVGIHKIGEINPTIDNLSVRIRVIRLWTLPSYGNSSLPCSIEMVWLDEDGEKIHASVKMALVSRFVNLVKEGISYQIRYFGVGLYEGNFKTTHYEYVVNLNQRTDVHKFPESFNFVSFDTLNALGYDYTYLRELNAFLGSGNKDGVVVVLQFIRNSMYGTKMFFNLEKANVIQFKNSFVRFEEPRDNIDAISNEAAFLKIYQGKIIEQLKELDTQVPNKAWCHCDSDGACFVVFDKETKQVLEKNCVEILDSLLLKGDLSDIPTLLLNLIDKAFLFIVEVQIYDNLHFSPSYKVKKMTDNVDLINKFKKDVDYTSGLLPTLKASSIIEGEKVEGAKYFVLNLLLEFSNEVADNDEFKVLKNAITPTKRLFSESEDSKVQGDTSTCKKIKIENET
ncbi:hypothetical protein Ahy_A01g003189 [Arachis hypogaea]|uniref:Replication protein A 70 kDa DNA-binding subunit B/D first OB fold domain-containing protein n=1 Tax=Arachis hypogaea TaxID=3818 RepID=A0A445ESE8_ARAHY|nr:hypothetical protein Ahy_A01g003189 [Arachis hypogaea]